jgi:hypothetical protein
LLGTNFNHQSIWVRKLGRGEFRGSLEIEDDAADARAGLGDPDLADKAITHMKDPHAFDGRTGWTQTAQIKKEPWRRVEVIGL